MHCKPLPTSPKGRSGLVRWIKLEIGMGRFRYETTDGSTYKLLLKNAKNNRRYMTPAESVLWECLRNRNLGVRFRRQHPIYSYIPDFVCIEKQLVVEVDGGYHFIGNQHVSDEERTR